MRGKEKEVMNKFRELFIIVVIENTNMEKIGLFMSTGIDGNGKMCMGIKCSMNNDILESSSWTYENGAIELGLQKAIEHMEIAISDQERSLYELTDNLSNVDSPHRGLTHALCQHHLVKHPWQNRIVGLATEASEIKAVEAVKSWIKYWFTKIVYECQFIRSYTLFEDYLKNNKHILVKTYNEIKDLWFLIKTKRWKWAKCYKSNVMNFDYQ